MSEDALLEIRSLLVGKDRAFLFVKVYTLLSAHISEVYDFLRSSEKDFETAQGQWSDYLSGVSSDSAVLQDDRKIVSLMGLICALSEIIENIPIDGLPIPINKEDIVFILHRREHPMIRTIAEKSKIKRPSSDLRDDLGELLKLKYTIFGPLSGINVKFDKVSEGIDREFCIRGAPERLRIGLFFPRIRLNISEVMPETSRLPPAVRCKGPQDEAAAQQEILDLAQALREQCVDILLLPELSTTDKLRQTLKEQIASLRPEQRPVLVIAGSEHIAEDGYFVNRTWTFDGRGRTVWMQDKCRAFFMRGEKEIEEGIQRSNKIILTDTVIGRVATPICLDFLHEALRPIWLQAGVDLILVPAFSPKLDNFRQCAGDFATRARVISVVANHPQAMEKENHATGPIGEISGSPGFIFLPVRGFLATDVPDEPPILLSLQYSVEDSTPYIRKC